MYRENYFIQDWCNEAGAKCGIVPNRKDKSITIYTERPGYFIGKGGELYYKYAELIKKEGWDKVNIVEIKEVFEPGHDYADIVEERAKAFFELEYDWITK